MISYKVYKQCMELSFYLFNILRSCYKAKFVPINWRAAREIYIPKASEPKESSISDFRSIALLNVEGKIFFGLLARRLFHHIVQVHHTSWLRHHFNSSGGMSSCVQTKSLVQDQLGRIKLFGSSLQFWTLQACRSGILWTPWSFSQQS